MFPPFYLRKFLRCLHTGKQLPYRNLSNLFRNDPSDKVKCFVYKFPDEDGKKYCDRVDSIARYVAVYLDGTYHSSFLDINRKIAEGGKQYQPMEPKGPLPKILNFIATTAKIEKQTAIPSGSVIGAYTTGSI